MSILTLTMEEFEENLTPLSMEDMSDSDDKVLRLKDALADAVYTLESLIVADGVSKDMVTGFEHIFPEHVSLASFTRSPTRTNYNEAKASLEGLAKDILSKIVDTILSLLDKLGLWLGKLVAKDGKKEAEEIYKKGKEVDKADIPEDKMLKVAESLNDAGIEHWNRLTELASYKPDTFMVDFFALKNYVYGNLMDKASDSLELVSNLLKSDRATAESLAIILANLGSETTKVLHDKTIDGVKFDGKVVSLVKGYQAKLLELQSTPANNHFYIEKLAQDYSKVKLGLGVSSGIIDKPNYHREQEFRKKLSTLEKELKNFKKAIKVDLDPERTKIVQSLLVATSDILSGVYMYTSLREMVLSKENQIQSALMTYLSHLLRTGK